MPTPARRRGGRVNAGQALALLLSLVLVSATGGVLLAGTVLPGVAVANGVTDLTSTAFDELPGSLEQQPLPEKSTILAADGTLLAEFYIRDRVVVPLSEIAEPMQKAVIATEDKRFYEHAGVDPQGMLRAAVRNAMSDDVQEGASTLTQQYVKNVLIEEAMAKDSRAEQLKALQEAKDDEGAEGYARKLREAKYAITLEKQMTKDEILEKYLNIAQFGVSVYGVEAAANFYFSKHAKDLDFAEAALIAGVTRSPSRWDPSRNPKEAKDRRDTVLELMRQQGYITDAQFQEGSSRKVEDMLKISEPKLGCMNADANVKGSGYFCDYVTKIIRNDPAFGKTEDDRLKLLYRGGLTITTTLRPKEQKAAYKSVTKHVPIKDKSGVAAVAVTVVPGSGQITAMAQNRVYNNTSETKSRQTSVNYATDYAYGGSRGFSPGSTYKPFTLLEWLKSGHSLNETINASKFEYPFSDFNAPCTALNPYEKYKFGNAEPGSGNMTVLNATKNSVNSAYVRMASELNLCNIFDGAAELGVHRAQPVDGNDKPQVLPSNVLGTDTVAPLTMAAALARGPWLRHQRIGHAIAIGLRDFLHLGPPRRNRGVRQAHVRPQQQQVEAGAEARLLEHAQRAAPARLFEARLRGEHLAHAERETLRDGDASLRGTRGAVHGIDNRADVVPLLLRLLFDDVGDGPVQQQREQEGRRHGLALLDALIRVHQALLEQPRHGAVRVTRQVAGHRRQQLREQAVGLQHFEAARAMAGQEQLERLVEQPCRRHAA